MDCLLKELTVLYKMWHVHVHSFLNTANNIVVVAVRISEVETTLARFDGGFYVTYAYESMFNLC
jgi:hypothetical protein